ncbi:MAG TPA: putative metal-binding motif-containing protein [Myxococcaceae bacterium]
MRTIWGAVVGMTLAACGPTGAPEQVEPEQQAQGLEAGCTALGPEMLEHTCEHATLGPFASVTASATDTFTSTSPNINSTHKYYTVTLPGSGTSYTGTVKFVPGSTGSWAFFLSQDIPITVKDSSGNTLTAALTDGLSGSTCTLTKAVVYNLTKSATYRVTLGTASGPTVGVSTERVEDYRVYYFQDADSDAYGNTNVFQLTACTPPTGYVTDDTDCNDANASIRPGATEIPGNGVDENCNGSDAS